MRGSKFVKKAHMKEDMELQITSMADVFTIILVFLLKSFSSGVSNISVGDRINLPEGKSSTKIEDHLRIQVSDRNVTVDDKPIMKLTDFQFDAADLDEDGVPSAITKALKSAKGRRPASKAQAPSAVAGEGEPSEVDSTMKLTIIADRKTPFITLRKGMTASGNEGYSDFDFMVVEGN